MKHKKPLVTIVAITYNHSKFIREAMDSFLMQKTDFPYEIVVHDDASTDGTDKILLEYQKKYPDIVKVRLEEKNTFSVDGAKFLEKMYAHAKGKYIAICEGDDYWTDASKLQRQVDYLEDNAGSTICFHPVIIDRENDEDKMVFPAATVRHRFTLTELLQHNFIQTNSVMYRNLGSYKGVCPDGILPQDWFTHIFHAKRGDIGFINKPMAVYRRHKKGLWWKNSANQIAFWERNAAKHMRFFENVEKIFLHDDKHLATVHDSIMKFVADVSLEVGRHDNYAIVTKIAETYPRYMAMALVNCLAEGASPVEQIRDLKKQITELGEDRAAREREKNELLYQIQLRDERIDQILSSSSWRLTKPLRKLNAGRGRKKTT